MKRSYRAGFCLLLCLFLCSCHPDVDFVIPQETVLQTESEYEKDSGIFVLINKNSKKYHLDADCVYASRISEANRLALKVKNEEYLLEKSYSPCSKCSSEK